MSIVDYETQDGIATITLNRPESLNSMNAGMMSGLSECFAKVEADDDVRVIVLTGAGRGFCSGADLAAMGDDGNAPTEVVRGDVMADVFNPAILAIANCRVPTICRING